MISLIICSRNSDISFELKKNIELTIGIEYELVVINNYQNKYSIFAAYNKGLLQAQFPYLCFMHEDILFHTVNWGEKVITHLENPKIGIIGIAGGHYMPKAPSSWIHDGLKTTNILQSSWENGKKKTIRIKELDYLNGNSTEVVIVDGVWFCMRKDLTNSISFDENTFRGFHCYDLDISLQTKKIGYEVHVVSDILIEHFSGGNWNNDWIENTILLFNKWEKYLPQIVGVNMSEEDQRLRENFAIEKFSLLREINNMQLSIDKIRNSKAYRLGKFLLKPFYLLNKFKIKLNHK